MQFSSRRLAGLLGFLLVLGFYGCDNLPKKPLRIVSPLNQQGFPKGTNIQVQLDAETLGEADSVRYLLGSRAFTDRQAANAFVLPTEKLSMGRYQLIVEAFYGKKVRKTDANIVVVSDLQPKKMSYKLVAELPHDISAFTEGLEVVNGQMLESLGQYDESDIRITDLKTGVVKQQQKLEKQYFGEGTTFFKDKYYQLTYKEKTGFIYDKTFKQIGTFPIATTEGWGLTHDDTHLIQSDGSSRLYFLNPETFKVEKTLEVCDHRQAIDNLNELEYVNGFIYANVWRTEVVLKIEAATGKVLAVADLSELSRKIKQHSQLDVMNGIAHNPANGHFYVTGKYWDKMFELVFEE